MSPTCQRELSTSQSQTNKFEETQLILDRTIEYPSIIRGEVAAYIQTHFANLYLGQLGNEKVAVKTWRILGMDPTSQNKFTKGLTREVGKWMQASAHPNIADIFGLTHSPQHSTGSVPSLVLPFYPNRDANEYLTRNPAVSALHLLSGIAAGLHHLHTRTPPIAHGKLQSSNILITPAGEPVLADIGLHGLPYPSQLVMSRTRESLNEVRWMAPELVDPPASREHGRDCGVDAEDGDGDGDGDEYEDADGYCATTASDVHSFGMTALELITRQRPFANHRNVYAVILDLTSGIRPPRPSNCTKMTDGCWELLESCWAHEPSARPDMGVVESWMRVLKVVEASDEAVRRRS